MLLLLNLHTSRKLLRRHAGICVVIGPYLTSGTLLQEHLWATGLYIKSISERSGITSILVASLGRSFLLTIPAVIAGFCQLLSPSSTNFPKVGEFY